MRASRLLSILITLQLRGRASASDLARQFEVSKRTIYRDVDELSAAGVPVYADRGAHGGFQLRDGYRTHLTGLTDAEAAAFPLASLPGAAFDLGVQALAAAARLKVLAALPAGASAGAARVAERFHVDPVDWYRRVAPPSQLQAVARAVWAAQSLRMRYESWNSVGTRTVDPLGIVLKAGTWYLVARAGGAMRIFRLAKILQVEALGRGFRRPPRFDLARFWREEIVRFEAGLRRGKATLRVAASAMDRIERLGADISEPLFAALPDDAGWRRAIVPIEGVKHAAGLLLAFGDEIEVVEPKELRDELVAAARRVLACYAARA